MESVWSDQEEEKEQSEEGRKKISLTKFLNSEKCTRLSYKYDIHEKLKP